MKSLIELNIKLFADGADRASMCKLYDNPLIRGFTTNPTLMHKAGICDYRHFAREILDAIPDRPISFEVFADELDEMETQAKEIASWGDNVVVKVPVTNTRREFCGPLIHRLTHEGVQVNVTAMTTFEQVQEVLPHMCASVPGYVSVFAGRIADTGRDPVPIMALAVEALKALPHVELIWASPRELLNIYHAEEIGCHVITVTNDILAKLHIIGKDLDDYSLETVQMFYEAGQSARFAF